MSAEKMKIAHTVYVRAHEVRCPYCDYGNDGWLGDPRDKETTCDNCGKQYMVAPNAELRMT